MKFRRTLRFHGLRRPRVRQSWNKFNLFNLFRAVPPRTQTKTFFQQKWAAKSLARGYHGEHIKENRWNRMFDRRLQSVVNMDPRYMAQHDGAEQAAGRGSGRHIPLPYEEIEAGRLGEQTPSNVNRTTPTPYMQMTFAPMERRLDIAVFRALFASSARQARQFVVHGAVKVNGKKMIYPGYLLNPGDMFEVDPERVLFATGAKKEASEDVESGEAAEEAEESGEAEETAATEEGSEEAGETAGETADASAMTAELTAEEIKILLSRAKSILEDPSEKLNVKRKRALRQFVKDAKSALNKANRASAATQAQPASVVQDLTELLSALSVSPSESQASAEETDDKGLTANERERFEELLKLDAENPVDPSKPYATPWRPRPYMAPFAFIPRYLEVNQNICAAVYLRDPVARPGTAEVPTPWPAHVNQLAHNWYLRRR